MSKLPRWPICLLALAASLTLQAAPEPAWEHFPDGSEGRVAEFRGTAGIPIAGYIRKPPGAGPFALVINLHGGNTSVEATYRSGRATQGQIKDYLVQNWAMVAIDFRPNGPDRAAPMDPREYDDTVKVIEQARHLPFADPDRIALTGGSHGGHVINRMASRVNARCAVLSSPTWIDSGQMQRALREETNPEIVTRLKLLMSFVDQIKDPKIRQAFDKASALDEAAQVRFPLLIIDGGQDISLPQWMVNEYVDKLRAAGKTVETYLPKAGDHGFSNGTSPEGHEAAARSLAFLKKYLGGPAAPRQPR